MVPLRGSKHRKKLASFEASAPHWGPVVRTVFSGMASMLLLGGEGDW